MRLGCPQTSPTSWLSRDEYLHQTAGFDGTRKHIRKMSIPIDSEPKKTLKELPAINKHTGNEYDKNMIIKPVNSPESLVSQLSYHR